MLFFFKQKTAYEMRISDWSSDVCSSDLYIAWLSDRRRWLAGDAFSRADIVAAAELSAVDYIGDVPWAEHGGAKDWYARVKSRPSFRAILADHISGVQPPKHYADLDF